MADSGDCYSKFDSGLSFSDHSISLSDSNRWAFESSDLDDVIATHFGSPQQPHFDATVRVVDIHLGHDDDDSIWENSTLRDLLAIQEEDQSDPFDNVEDEFGWEHGLPFTDDLEESLTEILMFDDDVDFAQPPELGGRVRCASRKMLENLPRVHLRKEDSIVCTICRDEIVQGETANKLPCSHFYHQACIVPWLEIKNTCPVCRFEFPTDDRS
ncbi:RING/U-box superfamily protein [Euphorbia peplus]|nr:RING/U-box superfamily protein [Euphorbia peplus]